MHVLCEKPAAVTEKELERLYALAEAHHVVFMEGIMAPHQPRFAALQAAVARAGKLSSAVFEFSQLSSRYPALERGEMPNIFNPALCEGALMDIGYYGVYLAAALFGEPEEVFARATFSPDRGRRGRERRFPLPLGQLPPQLVQGFPDPVAQRNPWG